MSPCLEKRRMIATFLAVGLLLYGTWVKAETNDGALLS
jgi:hypothetical protein